MSTSVFTDFYKYLGAVDKTNYQLQTNAQKKQKYTLALTAAGTIAGCVVPAIKTSKNTNMQYAVFTKERLKPLMTKEFDNAHKHQCIPRFSQNPITHIKEIKDSIKGYDSDIAILNNNLSKSLNLNSVEKEILQIQAKKLRLQEFLLEYETLFKKIKLDFREIFHKKITKKVITGMLIWSTIGTLTGIMADKIKEKGSTNENNAHPKYDKTT